MNDAIAVCFMFYLFTLDRMRVTAQNANAEQREI